MSRISNSLDVDKLNNGNPSTITQQEDVLPYFQNLIYPLLDENQLFSVPLSADECHGGGISNMPMPRVNINMRAAHEISNKNPTAGTEIYQHRSLPNNCSPEFEKRALNKGSMGRRSGKKDRHTKINTAKGLRDRRMRLSLQIARKFFDLQDRLGYDKASKTIEWLFSKSKKAINRLSSKASHATQMSNNNVCQKGSKLIEISEEQQKVKTQKSATTSTKHNAKDLRDKARARARERTREKKMIRCLEKSKWSLSDQAYSLSQLGPAGNPNPLFEIGQESLSNYTSSQDNISTSQSSIYHHLVNMELLGTTSSPSGSVSCSMFGHDHNINGDLFSSALDSYSNNLYYLGWDFSSEEFQ